MRRAPEDWKTRSDAQPITGVMVTIMSGSRSGERVGTDENGYYRFANVREDELHLRVEKEHFEPKEVIVSRSFPTQLANGGAVLNYPEDPQQQPGNILMGQRWQDEVRFIFEETLIVHDLLYAEGGRLPKGTDLGGYYSRGVIVIYSPQYADWQDPVGLLGTFAHEIAHAYQHALVSVDGSAWEIHGWIDTPVGIAYREARRKDWQEVGKAQLDIIYGDGGGGGVPISETAAETLAHYWSVDRWGGRTAYGNLRVTAPNRFKWAQEWGYVKPPPPAPAVAIPDKNLRAAIESALGKTAGTPISKGEMARLTRLDARNSNIKDLTGLEHATRLGSLELRENQILDIGPLANLKNLQQLILDENNVRDITPLKSLTQLTRLLIGSNPISDFTPLSNLNQLEGLSLYGNQMNDLTPLGSLTKLESLWLDNNNISNLTPLTGLVNLELLYLRHNEIRDMSPLVKLPVLKELRLERNPLSYQSIHVHIPALQSRGVEVKFDAGVTRPPDINKDGNVNVLDLIFITESFGTAKGDINGDGTTDVLDLRLVAQAFSE